MNTLNKSCKSSEMITMSDKVHEINSCLDYLEEHVDDDESVEIIFFQEDEDGNLESLSDHKNDHENRSEDEYACVPGGNKTKDCSNSAVSETFQVDAKNSKTSPIQKVSNADPNTKDLGESDNPTDNCRDDAYEESVQTSRAIGKYQCFMCSFNCDIKFNLSSHLKIHFKIKPRYVCTVCKKQFPTKRGFDSHIKSIADIKPYPCERCEKSFISKYILKRHWKETHSDMEPLKCTKCEYKTFLPQCLARHIAIHRKERPFKCPHCSHAFKFKCNLTQHTKIHTGDKHYKCDICHFRFMRANSLRKHHKTHFKPHVKTPQ